MARSYIFERRKEDANFFYRPKNIPDFQKNTTRIINDIAYGNIEEDQIDDLIVFYSSDFINALESKTEELYKEWHSVALVHIRYLLGALEDAYAFSNVAPINTTELNFDWNYSYNTLATFNIAMTKYTVYKTFYECFRWIHYGIIYNPEGYAYDNELSKIAKAQYCREVKARLDMALMSLVAGKTEKDLKTWWGMFNHTGK